MIAQALAEFPNECCGLFAGTIGTDGIARAERRYPLVNELASPTEYLSEPRSMLAASKDMRKHAIDILALYHSHPSSDPIPSRKDRERNEEARPLLGDLMHLIVGLRESVPQVSAWWLSSDAHREADWEVV
jgi:proteasome lid subunit RPN8/RPN11